MIRQQVVSPGGKAVTLDHFSPDGIDHLYPELNYYQLRYFNIEMKTGEMWSICPAFAVGTYFDDTNVYPITISKDSTITFPHIPNVWPNFVV